jgi:hypothetical protein
MLIPKVSTFSYFASDTAGGAVSNMQSQFDFRFRETVRLLSVVCKGTRTSAAGAITLVPVTYFNIEWATYGSPFDTLDTFVQSPPAVESLTSWNLIYGPSEGKKEMDILIPAAKLIAVTLTVCDTFAAGDDFGVAMMMEYERYSPKTNR